MRVCSTILLGAAILTSFSGCGRLFGSGSASSELDCPTVDEDQKASLMWRVEDFPIHLRVDSEFTEDERQAIRDAVAEWNSVGQVTSGTNVFEIEYAALSSSYRTMNPNDCPDGMGDEETMAIVRERSNDHWSAMGFGTSTPAATIRCSSGGRIEQQVSYMNVNLVRGRFAQIAAHELGHAMGLNHSCNDSGNTGKYRSCSGLPSNHPYRVARMYPVISSDSTGAPEVLLKNNDKTRGSCLIGTQ